MCHHSMTVRPTSSIPSVRLIHLLRLGFRYGGTASTITIFFAGFLIPVNDMRPYFGWLHYVSPIKYAFDSVGHSWSSAFLAEFLTHV